MQSLTPGAPQGAPTDTRVHALDHLRALAMLMGVVFHAALAYSPLVQPIWPGADRQNWWGVDAAIWLPHLIRMPLFFLVAGFFTAWLLAQRGGAGLARQRVRRILLPFLLAWPLVHVATSFSTQWAMQHVDHPAPLLVLFRQIMAMPDPPSLPLSTGHLWFLYYLLLFSLLLWVARSLDWDRFISKWLDAGPAVVSLSLPLLLWPGFMLTGAPHPAPEGLLPQFWAMLIYGPFFALGLGLHGRLHWLAPLQRWFWPGVLLCLGLYALFLLRLAEGATLTSTPWWWAAIEALIAGWGSLLALLAGLRWMQHANALMRYLAASSYWTYLWHLPILLTLQYLLMDHNWAWPLKFALCLSATLAICLLSYEWLVRRTALRRHVG